MAYTGQQICDRVREQINDDYKREIADAEILNYVNDVAKQILNMRPDLRIGSFGTTLADIALGGNFPFPDQFLPPVVDYCVSMCQRPDDEDAQTGQSQGALVKFYKDIYGS
jgi:hypothetical protein